MYILYTLISKEAIQYTLPFACIIQHIITLFKYFNVFSYTLPDSSIQGHKKELYKRK